MDTAAESVPSSAQAVTGSPAQVAALQAEIQSLKTQLDWFKKQLFGQKPEKRLIEPNPDQGALFDRLAPEEETATPTEKITYTRRKGKKQRDEDCATDQGLRFDGDVPIERIELSPAGLNDQNRDQYEIIGEKITRRLAQQPGSRCQPWRAKRRLVDPSSREAALFSRRALRQRGNKVG
ncbi:transposase domain-containing protein, partial [Thiolapillus sp.]|uniref:transposase domain-containing protein n=1 Tax=Thiolapillus sp. TaxID=2017437 RepID=UPI003AF763A4